MTRIAPDWLRAPEAQQVCRFLIQAGHQAWFVGGAVRDALMGLPAGDLDLATDARPETVMALAAEAGIKALPTGIAHGTVTLVLGASSFEVTTFRRDVSTDGRRATVAFADSVAEDAQRRDFTMNALYLSPDGELADPLGGLPDLKARRVRFIGDPAQRITEDYLRILRFFRFHALYGDPAAGIDAEGLAACADNLGGLAGLSAERITAELLRLLSAPEPTPAVASFAATGGFAHILPGAVPALLGPLVHLEALLGIPPDPIRRLAALTATLPPRLRLSKAQARQHAQITDGTPATTLAYRFGVARGIDRLLLDHAARGALPAAEALAGLRAAAAAVCPVTAADFRPALTGPALGVALKEAEARWIASGFILTKEDLLG